MTVRNYAALAVALVLSLGVFTPVKASQWNKKTIIDFSQPVRLPGEVTLPAGEYVFKLVDSEADRNIVQVTNKEGDEVFATVLAIADYRLEPKGKTVMTFGETPACQPRTIKTWYYPGDTFGQRFVYSEDEAEEIASGCAQPVPVIATADIEKMKVEPKVATVRESSVFVHTPDKKQEDYSDSYFSDYDRADETGYEGRPYEEPVQMAQSQQPRTTYDSSSRERLPDTASNAPLFGLIGLMLLALSAGLAFVWKRQVS